jgi:hypothetical protein
MAEGMFGWQWGPMGFMTRRQVASGIALVISALYVVVLNVKGYDIHEQFYGIVLVCIFAFFFLSRTDQQRTSRETPWWWS